jgi:hypothetical protein
MTDDEQPTALGLTQDEGKDQSISMELPQGEAGDQHIDIQQMANLAISGGLTLAAGVAGVVNVVGGGANGSGSSGDGGGEAASSRKDTPDDHLGHKHGIKVDEPALTELYRCGLVNAGKESLEIEQKLKFFKKSLELSAQSARVWSKLSYLTVFGSLFSNFRPEA